MQCTYLGGTEQTMYALMRGLHGREFDFRILSMHPVGEGAALMAAAGIPTIGHEYRGKFGWRTHLSLRRSVAHTPCDLMLVTGPTLSGSLALTASSIRRRVLTVHYYHGRDPASLRRWRAFYRLCAHQYNVITYPTDFIRREAEAIAPWIAPRARTVRYGVPRIGRVENAARAELKRRFGLDPARPVIGNASRLDFGKRLDVFLNVAQRVASCCPDAQFLVAGDGPARGALEARASELGIAPQTCFPGWVRDGADVFGALDVLLFNSDADASPRTVMESMALGVPVVASVPYGGTGEIIDHGCNGVLLPSHDEPALAEHVLEVLADASLREERIAQGLRTVRERFGHERFLAEYRAIFEEVLAA